MTELSFLAMSEDGSYLLLTAEDGQEFRVAASDDLRAALAPTPAEAEGTTSPSKPRKARARAARTNDQRTPQATTGQLSPAEVQKLLRHGADVDQVAAQAGLDPDHVANFAAPVLQERAFVASQASTCATGEGDRLVDAVTERLHSRGITSEPQWDAWRREDGMWTVVVRVPEDAATVSMSDEVGEWTYDPKTRSISSDNDTARWFTNEPAPEVVDPQPAAPADRVIVIEDVDSRARAVPSQPVAEPVRPAGPSGTQIAGQMSIEDDAPAPAPPPEVRVAPTPQPVAATGKPLSRRAARRQEASKRKAGKREPTWDEILFGAARPDDAT